MRPSRYGRQMKESLAQLRWRRKRLLRHQYRTPRRARTLDQSTRPLVPLRVLITLSLEPRVRRLQVPRDLHELPLHPRKNERRLIPRTTMQKHGCRTGTTPRSPPLSVHLLDTMRYAQQPNRYTTTNRPPYPSILRGWECLRRPLCQRDWPTRST